MNSSIIILPTRGFGAIGASITALLSSTGKPSVVLRVLFMFVSLRSPNSNYDGPLIHKHECGHRQVFTRHIDY